MLAVKKHRVADIVEDFRAKQVYVSVFPFCVIKFRLSVRDGKYTS
jgi:hypothetical protein